MAGKSKARGGEPDRELIRKLTLAVDQSPASVIITDTSGVIQYVNQRFVEATGWTAEEVVGKTPRLLQSGQTPVEMYQELWATIRRGEVFRGEVLNRTKSGELRWHAVSISPLRAPDGTVTHFVANQEDVTDRKRADQALRERDERFRQLADNIREVFFIVAADFSATLYANPAYETIWGRSLASLYEDPRSFLEAVSPEDQGRVVANMSRMQHGEESEEVEFRVHRPDGSVRSVVAHAVPIRNERGEVYRISGVVMDVTEKRVLEEQFRQAQKMEAVGRLAGGVAHDFNNLLTVITSYAELLYQELEPDDLRRQDLTEVLKAAQAAAALTRQLLAFSRQQVIEPRILELEQIVLGSEKMLKRLIGEDIMLVTALAPHPNIVKIDPGQLEQVIMNLAVNARDAMPGGGRLTIETAAVDLDEEYVRSHWPALPGRFAMLALSDTGMGMDAATQARVFEPFFTTKEKGKGTGLGLSTVYGIVKQSGGFIWVYSEPGKGATFKIYLPLQRAAAEALEQPGEAGEVPRGSETILLVEDADAVRGAARQSLQRFGYRVLSASEAEAALRIATEYEGEIHLLVTDVVMPGMSGPELASRFGSRRPGTRVLYTSGYTDDAIVRHGVLQPGIAFLQKPFSPESLARKVRKVLDAPPA